MPVDEFNSTFGESNNNVRVPSYGDRRVSSYGNNSNFERVIGLNTDGRNRVASNPRMALFSMTATASIELKDR